MLSDTSLVAAIRPEPDLPGRWGLYSQRRERWLDVVFATEREATAALEVLLAVGKPRDPDGVLRQPMPLRQSERG
jgi:hypothetical protein